MSSRALPVTGLAGRAPQAHHVCLGGGAQWGAPLCLEASTQLDK